MDGELLFRGEEVFCILLNINGQKYTIGTNFTSREEQGEFVHLGQIFEVPIGNWVCEINVKNVKYYVSSSACGDPSIFINDVKISTQTELRFGDKLSICQSGHLPTLDLIFKERKLEGFRNVSSPTKIESETATTEFIQNELILSKILSHLSVPELKSARFVSKLWNVEGFKILRKRVHLRLHFTQNYDKDAKESMRLFRYSAEMLHNPLPHWSINLPAFALNRPKLLADLNFYLFSPNTRIYGSNSIKRLVLGGRIASELAFQRRIALLQANCQSLEELSWGGNLSLNLYTNPPSSSAYKLPATIVFNKLRTFTFSLEYSNAPDLIEGIWMKDLIIAVRGVSTLRLHCSASLSTSFLTQLGHHEVYKRFSNLTAITVQNLNPAGIRLLLNLELVQPLKKLDLGWLSGGLGKECFIQPFAQLLRKHSETLESLLFTLPFIHEPSPGRPGKVLNFPVFPKLERLTIRWSVDVGIKLKFWDGSGYVRYKRDLPSLKSFTLWPLEFKKDYLTGGGELYGKPGETSGHFYEAFFPLERHLEEERMEVCETLQFLDVLNNSTRSEGEEKWFKGRETILAKMFPNVHNSWINSIRESYS